MVRVKGTSLELHFSCSDCLLAGVYDETRGLPPSCRRAACDGWGGAVVLARKAGWRCGSLPLVTGSRRNRYRLGISFRLATLIKWFQKAGHDHRAPQCGFGAGALTGHRVRRRLISRSGVRKLSPPLVSLLNRGFRFACFMKIPDDIDRPDGNAAQPAKGNDRQGLTR